MPGARWSEHATGRRPIRVLGPILRHLPPPPPSTPEAEADEMLPPQGYRGSYRPIKPIRTIDERVSRRLERQVLEMREDLANPVATRLSRH